MRFSDLIGQQAISEQLLQMWSLQRMPHAMILLGPEGCGKLTLGLALAQFLLCDQKTAHDACGQCNACLKMRKYVHPDLHFVFPVVGSKVTSDQYLVQWRSVLQDNPYLNANDWLQYIGAENKQGNISKEECLSIVKKLSLKTFEARSKVMIIWLPEYLGKEGNRLLKLIEEPPENTYFILVAQNTELILNTILSRCQIVKVNPLSDEAIISALQSRFPNLEENQIAPIAYLANGNFNEAIKIANAKTDNNSKLLLEWLRKCYKGNGVELVAWSDAFSKIGRENQKQFFNYSLHFLREFLQVRLFPEAKVRLAEGEHKSALNLSKVLDVAQIEAMSKLFTDTAYYIERNGNPKIIMLDCSIQLNKIMKKAKVHSPV